MLHRSSSGREFGGTSSLVGQFLHPSPVQSSRFIQRMQTVQLFLTSVFFTYAGNLEVEPVSGGVFDETNHVHICVSTIELF